jgi:hypothetical protein
LIVSIHILFEIFLREAYGRLKEGRQEVHSSRRG